jgi:7-cyano-7-deazaguanine synthase
MRTIVLLSGGLDSALVLALCVKEGWECQAIAFDYAQPHVVELEAAQAIAAHYGVELDIVDIYRGVELPKIDDVVFAGRNLIFVAHAVAIAQVRKFEAVAVGCNASDWVRFPDCRPIFWTNLRTCVQDAYGIDLKTPLIHHSKIEVVQAARELNVPIDLTWSCYNPIMDPEHGDHMPCGKCLACETRNGALQWSASV